MRIFVTGASGWIGWAVVPELLRGGHTVLGLARSDAAAEAVRALGAEVQRGHLDDLAVLSAGASACDGVVHLGYNHDFSRMGEAAETDHRAIEALGDALVGTDGPFVVASGVIGFAPGHVASELDQPDASAHPRLAGQAAAQSYADRGVRVSSVRFAPTVHGDGDHGFVAHLIGIARERGASGYVDEGTNRWPAVHRLDAGRLVRLMVERAAPGSAAHAVAETGIATRAIAEAIGAGLGVPVISVPSDQAADHFGWIGRFFAADAPVTNEITRRTYGWEPTHPGLLDDLAEGHYFTGS